MRYFEIEFSNGGDNGDYDQYSICIVGERKPSVEEAEEFCKEDMKILGYERVEKVLEIDKHEAHMYFDMSDEKNFPVFR